MKNQGLSEYHDIAFPLTGDLRKAINKAVISEYENPSQEKKQSISAGLKENAEKAAGQEKLVNKPLVREAI